MGQEIMSSGNAAFHFIAEGYDTRSKGLIKGRQAAGEGFLKGFARHADVNSYYCYTQKPDDARRFAQIISDAAPGSAAQVHFIPSGEPHRLSEPGMIFHPGPDLAAHAWARRGGSQQNYSITGVTHTICSHGAMESIGQLLTAPFQPWDALICTSRAVAASVREMLGQYQAYLEARLGACRDTPLHLPVIPLGVDCDMLGPGDENTRLGRTIRAKLGLDSDTVAILFLGRLSYHAKANPISLYLAAQAAQRSTGRQVALLMAGEFPNQGVARDFEDGAKRFAPSVNTLFLDGRNEAVRRGVWHAADIFCSPSDNIQETFGLAPIEALAAGLPVVAGDWDGYRDTVRDGVDGMLVPTYAPAPGAGEDLAYRHQLGIDNYDHYIGYSSQCIAVDVQALSTALTRLVQSEELRRKFGAKAAEGARTRFDWPVVVKAYQTLWAELSEIRAAGQEIAPRAQGRPPHPLRQDPFACFADYPTGIIGKDGVTYEPVGDDTAFELICTAAIMRFAASILVPADELRAIWRDPMAADLTRPRVARSLGWLLKAGLVRVIADRAVFPEGDFGG